MKRYYELPIDRVSTQYRDTRYKYNYNRFTLKPYDEGGSFWSFFLSSESEVTDIPEACFTLARPSIPTHAFSLPGPDTQ